MKFGKIQVEPAWPPASLLILQEIKIVETWTALIADPEPIDFSEFSSLRASVARLKSLIDRWDLENKEEHGSGKPNSTRRQAI